MIRRLLIGVGIMGGIFILAFGIIFELPVFVLFLAKLGIINDAQLRSNRKIVILVVFVIAAFLTPPDMVSQVLMAVPLIFLYEFSIIIAKTFGKKIDTRRQNPRSVSRGRLEYQCSFGRR